MSTLEELENEVIELDRQVNENSLEIWELDQRIKTLEEKNEHKKG